MLSSDAPRRFGVEAALALSAALTLAFLDATTGVLHQLKEFSYLPRILSTVSADVVVFFAAWAVLAGAVRLIFRSKPPEGSIRLLVFLLVFLDSFVLLASMENLVGVRLYGADVPVLGILGLVSALAAVGVSLLARDRLQTMGQAALFPATAGIPALAAIAFLATWWARYHLPGASLFAATLAVLLFFGALGCATFVAGRARTAGRAMGFMAALAAAVVLGSLPRPSREAPSSAGAGEAPHTVHRILLITIDTLRADALSIEGDSDASTPEIDKLARQGFRFTRAFSPAPWTLPSVASILTGQPPTVHGIHGIGATFPPSLDTLAQDLRRAGYLTTAIGANAYLKATHGLSKGFDSYRMYGGAPVPIRKSHIGARLLRAFLPGALTRSGTTEELTDLAMSWLSDHRSKDFFLWVHFLDPHVPYTPPARFLPLGTPPARIGNVFARQNSVRNGSFVPTLEEREWIRRLYLGEVRYVDWSVGRVLARLQSLGLYDSTLIVLTSDHGEEFWEHGGYEHGHSLHTEVLHVPLIVKAPNGMPGGVASEPVSVESVAPTILDLAGAPPSAAPADAPSLAGRVLGRVSEVPEHPLFSGSVLYFENQTGVLFHGVKYIRAEVSGQESLYDVTQDPGETLNIAASRPDLIAGARMLIESEAGRTRQLRERLGAAGEEKPMDEETKEQLRSLGYVQ